MFSKEKISMPVHLPQFLLNWLKIIQILSQVEQKGIYIEFYFKNILIYLFILRCISF